jgi:hypothetical protein
MENFREGECYFRVSFLDRAMTRPVVDTLVFVGMNLSTKDKKDTWYFQDAHSYNASGPAHERVGLRTLRSSVTPRTILEGC